MPFIDGETLRSKLDRETQLGIDEAVRIATSVADALDYAHRHGVIHRDIKPENILLHDGRPMVADFGIALAVSAAAGGRMTETGLSLGTPHYMSPEQATAEKEITARSDVYSLGSVLYEMLTGSPPHVGASAQQIIMKIVTEEAAPVTKLRKAVPPNVAAAVARSLEKLPADRFESARAFGEALADPHFTAAPATGAVGTRASDSYRPVMLGLGIALAVMTVVAGWALRRPGPPGHVNRYGLALPSEQAPDPGGFALVTSDASRIVYVGPSSRRPGHTQLWVKPRDALTATALGGTDGASAAALSPDDAWLAVVQASLLRRLPIGGGAFTLLAEDASNVPGSVAWLDDGTIVYAGKERSELIRIPPGGGSGTVVWSSDSVTPMNLTPLVGGRGVLFHACRLPCDLGDLWALDLRDRSARPVVRGARAGHYLPTGHLVYVDDASQAALVVPFELRSLHPRGTAVAVIDSVAMEGTSPYFWVSAAGTVVMRRGTSTQRRRFELVWVDRSGRETQVDSSFIFQVTEYAGNHGWSLSPDGTRLAIGLNTASGDDIWIKLLPRGPVSRATYGSRPESRPRWTADGRSVTAVATHGVILRRADGTGSDSLLWPGLVDEAALSPDGSWLILRMGARAPTSGGRDIYGLRLGVDSALTPLVVTPYDENAFALSPDGRWLAYESDETGRVEVFIRPFPNTIAAKIQVSSSGGSTPLWARNGRELFFLSPDNTMMAVPVAGGAPLQLGEPRALFQRRGPLAGASPSWYTPWDVAPDGRFIMVRSVETERSIDAPLIVVENWFEELNAKAAR